MCTDTEAFDQERESDPVQARNSSGRKTGTELLSDSDVHCVGEAGVVELQQTAFRN